MTRRRGKTSGSRPRVAWPKTVPFDGRVRSLLSSVQNAAASIRLWAAIICGLALMASPEAQGFSWTPFVGVQGGLHLWPAYSNRDQVEADTAPGYSWALVAGVDLGWDPPGSTVSGQRKTQSFVERLGGRVALEAGQRFSDIHGLNTSTGQSTADGSTLRVTTVHLNFWPSYEIIPRWEIYLGIGGGVSWLRGLGSRSRVASFETGLGLRYALPIDAAAIWIDIGWRSYFADGAQFRNSLIDFDTHGAALGVHWSFD